MALGREAIELSGVQVMVAPRGAVLQRERELASRRLDVAEPELGKAEPEMKLVVFRRAAHLLGEGGARRLEVPRLHRGDPQVEEMERRMALDARELAVGRRGLCGAPELVQRQREVGPGAGIFGLVLEHPPESKLGRHWLPAAQVDDAERV